MKDSSWLLAAEDAQTTRSYWSLGLLNGLLIGLAIAVGVWGLEAPGQIQLPAPLIWPVMLLGAAIVALIGGLTGWLTARWQRVGLTMLAWLVAALLIIYVIVYAPYQGRTLLIWLIDGRFWGAPIYVFPGDTFMAIILASIFLILSLVVLAFLQEYRLDGMYRELGEDGRLTAAAWLLLLLPLPVVVAAGLATKSIIGDTSGRDLEIVYQAIEVGREYEGDLFQLGLQQGVNYSAIQGVRHQMQGPYTLMFGEVDPGMATTFVVVHFSNGAWINCRVVNEQLSFCYDAAPPYTTGLASLITGAEAPPDCRGCLPRVNDEWRAWLRARQQQLGNAPHVYRLGQWGGYVVMRVEAAGGAVGGPYAIECRFQGVDAVTLENCYEP